MEPGNSAGSGASDAISGGDATEHNCGVAEVQTEQKRKTTCNIIPFNLIHTFNQS